MQRDLRRIPEERPPSGMVIAATWTSSPRPARWVASSHIIFSAPPAPETALDHQDFHRLCTPACHGGHRKPYSAARGGCRRQAARFRPQPGRRLGGAMARQRLAVGHRVQRLPEAVVAIGHQLAILGQLGQRPGLQRDLIVQEIVEDAGSRIRKPPLIQVSLRRTVRVKAVTRVSSNSRLPAALAGARRRRWPACRGCCGIPASPARPDWQGCRHRRP